MGGAGLQRIHEFISEHVTSERLSRLPSGESGSWLYESGVGEKHLCWKY